MLYTGTHGGKHSHTHTEFNQNTKETGLLKDTIFVSDYCLYKSMFGEQKERKTYYMCPIKRDTLNNTFTAKHLISRVSA